jgi:hypothetical protein
MGLVDVRTFLVMVFDEGPRTDDDTGIDVVVVVVVVVVVDGVDVGRHFASDVLGDHKAKSPRRPVRNAN